MNPGWHPDPSRAHELRYWDGSRWTEHVVDRGVQSVDPLPPAPGGGQAGGQAGSSAGQQSGQPGGQHPGGEGQVPAHTAGAAAGRTEGNADQSPPQQGRPQAQGQAQGQGQGRPGQAFPAQGFPGQGYPVQGRPGGDPLAGLSGDLVDGRFAEVTGDGPALQNSKLLRVRVTEPFLARQGSMVAYQGNLSFHYQGAGVGRVIKKALTGEGLPLMRVEGVGDCFIADTAKTVHLLRLANAGISVNGDNVLAFSQSLQWNIERVKGAGMATGGLFNTTLHGTGWLAIVTDGEPVVLDASQAPTFADTDAIVAWSADLQTTLHSSMSAGALIGRGSGEAVQIAFSGRGFVIVQPSEGVKVPRG